MSKTKLPIPIGARLFIKPDVTTIGGLEVSIPTATETCTVLAIGKGWDLEAEPVKVGDRIHVKSWAHDIISQGDQTYTYVWQKTGGFCGKI
jgi:hypothetical protein